MTLRGLRCVGRDVDALYIEGPNLAHDGHDGAVYRVPHEQACSPRDIHRPGDTGRLTVSWYWLNRIEAASIGRGPDHEAMPPVGVQLGWAF